MRSGDLAGQTLQTKHVRDTRD